MRFPIRALPCGEKAFLRLYRFGLTPSQAEEYFGIPEQSVRNWFRRGKFRRTEAARIGKELRVLPSALERLRALMERD